MRAKDVAEAINSTGVAEVIKINEGPNSLHIVHRVVPKRLRDWVAILEYVLARKQGWEDHICKRYFRQGGKIRYAWNVIAQWKHKQDKQEVIQQLVRNFSQAAQQIPKIAHQLESYPLVGAKENRNAPQGPRNPRAAGPMTGGPSQKGAHRL